MLQYDLSFIHVYNVASYLVAKKANLQNINVQ